MPKRVELTMNVIEAVAAVAEKLAGSKLKIKTSKEFSHAVAHLNDYFGTDERQTWLLCAMLALHFENMFKEESWYLPVDKIILPLHFFHKIYALILLYYLNTYYPK